MKKKIQSRKTLKITKKQIVIVVALVLLLAVIAGITVCVLNMNKVSMNDYGVIEPERDEIATADSVDDLESESSEDKKTESKNKKSDKKDDTSKGDQKDSKKSNNSKKDTKTNDKKNTNKKTIEACPGSPLITTKDECYLTLDTQHPTKLYHVYISELSDKTFIIRSSNPTVAKVSPGTSNFRDYVYSKGTFTIRAFGAGSANITIEMDKIIKTIHLTVTKPKEVPIISLKLGCPYGVSIYSDEWRSLELQYQPSNANNWGKAKVTTSPTGYIVTSLSGSELRYRSARDYGDDDVLPDIKITISVGKTSSSCTIKGGHPR